ncbi:MAG: response regulator RpfG family c-di-GMP phosphodiesterase [Cyclobacteriaceae bacterium]|jgi:response regulator RpfG family c-di-GMP phosphodiesterase
MSDLVKILYVDDEQGNIDYFKTVFRREYEVLTAKSGKEGLETLQKHPEISVILTDQRMPRMTGIEFLKNSMEISLDPVRILVTGYADMDTVIKAINQGHIFYYISKPWTFDEMKIVVSRAIENYRLTKTNKELLLLSERKEKEMVITELESLRNQVNPHFLFNCLNTLRALVPDNIEARDFISKLSNIYRYMLEHNKDNMVLLSDELKFCINYFHLQNTRFQKALEFINDIDLTALGYKIPSSSLQILIENTMKHNNATFEHPLVVTLYNEEGWLVVKNNYQPKKHVVSTFIGQENLMRRYSYMTDMKPVFFVNDGYYYSKIPLLVD